MSASPDQPERVSYLAARAQQTSLLVVLAALMLLCLVALAGRVPIAAADAAGRPAVEGRLDPNVAPWWELAQLPGVGEVTAKAIVAYRETCPPNRPAFRSSDDLQAVKGIGPKTAAALEDYLVFAGTP